MGLFFHKDQKNIVQNSSDSIWTKTSLHDFGFKCMMNKHEKCTNLKCKCFCHMIKEN